MLTIRAVIVALAIGGAGGLVHAQSPVTGSGKAFPNRPVVAGDIQVDTTNKYIRKGWQPGMKK